MEEVVAGILKGDFAPAAAAYGGEVPVERLRETWGGRLKELQAQYGPVRSHEVLGTAFEPTRDVTVVRLRFEHGTVERAFVWNRDAPEHLEGISSRGLDPKSRCLPVRGGGFATWNPATGASQPLRFEPVPGNTDGPRGGLRLRFGAGDQAFTAVREE
jgi:hypothetical protein